MFAGFKIIILSSMNTQAFKIALILPLQFSY